MLSPALMRFGEAMRAKTHRRFTFGTAAWLLASTVSVPSLAQSTSANADAQQTARDQAEGFMRRGVEQYKKGEFELARVEFARAFALVQHPAIARNLADTEMQLGRYRDAAEHWSFFLKTVPANRDRTDGERGLAECRKHVARLVVAAEEKAAISVDGKPVGEAPLANELWLEPGEHVVEARLSGRTPAMERVVLAAGDERNVALVHPTGEGAAPEPAAAVAVEPIHAERISPSSAPFSREGATSARTPVLVGGVALTTVALGVGVVYGVKARSASGDANSASDKIRGQLAEQGSTSACLSPPPSLAKDCEALGTKVDSAKSSRSIAQVAFVAAGVLGVATVATYLLWPRSSSSSASLVVAPWHSARTSGVVAEGSF